MKYSNLTFIVYSFLFLGISSCAKQEPLVYKTVTSEVIPIPNNSEQADGFFEINAKTAMVFDHSLENAATFLKKHLAKGLGYQLKASNKKKGIIFSVDTTLTNKESYSITVDRKKLHIRAGSDQGAFYAVQTLRQLLPPSFENNTYQENTIRLDLLKIEDSPRFKHRGFMLDVARHFFTVDEVKHIIDLLAMYKINILHLHLSDDQGWRIEIKSWLNLTSYGGTSSVKNEKAGFYTQEDYKEIQQYALERHITIIPEIDMPGHTNAALASYPELNCNNKTTDLYTGTRVGFSSLCIDKEITYTFVEDVIKELSDLTLGDYIHIGGDESHQTSKEDYIRFMNKAMKLVKAYGKKPIGWDEIVHTDIESDALVQFWGNAENAKQAPEKNVKLIMSPAQKIYLDIKYNDSTKLGLTWAGLNSIEDAYSWEPATYTERINETDIIGIEAPLWTETITNIPDMEYMIFPRLTGVAEIAWSKEKDRNWETYKTRLAKHKARMDSLGIHFYASPLINWK